MVWAAQLLRRPVKWTATRTETFLSDAQARDHDTTARMGFDRDGRIVAMQIDTLAALGGYLSNFAPSIPGNSYPQTVTGLYRTPNLHLRVRGVYTNTVPVDAYRGSGRPEATWTNERLIERGARELGIDAVEIRRRNLIARADFPYPAPGGRVYDSGDPPALLDRLLAAADYAALRREQGRLRSRGVLMGIGLAAFIDKAGTGPSANLAKRGGLHGGWESAIVRVHSDGKVTIFSGSHSHGQGHEITFCQIAADRLGLPIDDISLVEGRYRPGPVRQRHLGRALDLRRRDGGLSRRRQGARQGPALRRPGARMRGGRHRLCPRHLHRARHRSVDRLRRGRRPRLSRRAAAAAAARPASKSPSSTIRLTPTIRRPCISPWSIVDADTGAVRLRAFYAADDCGVVINPMIVEGQVHGGLAQGVGQALTERIVYDRSSGQLLTASFLDYGMPRAARSARVPHHLHRDAGAEQSARRQGRKRERRDRRAGRDRQRGDRCACGISACATSPCRSRRRPYGARCARHSGVIPGKRNSLIPTTDCTGL